ncbi:MAG TPA: hypothetical protein DEB46_13875 [Myxococcales bacterium]|nr:hypothetical protein [Myxococcales bacterium]
MIPLVGLISCLIMLFCAAVLLFRIKEIQRFGDDVSEPLAAPPSLSIIIAACNEENTIEPALRRLMSDCEPNWEIIVVEDRSSDGTRALLERLAADSEHRLKLVLIDELPDGWLGKVHALHQGSLVASGDWFLFSDADIHIDGALIRQTLAHVERQRLDHLALLPKLMTKTFLTRIVIAAFVAVFALSSSRKRRQDAAELNHGVGVGAFNLCRRSVFRRSEGFEWLRLEVADDLALGLAMKRAGARHEVLVATWGLEVEWYPDLAGMFRGLEKNSFGAACHYSYPRALGAVVGLSLWALGPLCCVWTHPFACFLAYGSMAAVGFLGARHLNWNALPFFFAPVGFFFIGLMIANSAWSAWRRGAIRWRGTDYDLDELRRCQVLRL